MAFIQCSTETTTASSHQAPIVDSDHRRVLLPEELSPENVLVLSCESSAEGGVCDVYVLGTHHSSEKSQREAKATVSFLKPEVVFLELCRSRKALLKNFKPSTEKEVIAALKKKDNTFEVLFGWKIGRAACKNAGREFQVAYEEANKYGDLCDRPKEIGDRPKEITYRRAWSKMPLWDMTKLLCYLLFPPSQKLRSNKFCDHPVRIFSEEFPTVVETFVHERDQYMSAKLLKHASKSRSVVAVVGKKHLQGIKKYWKQPVAVKDLMAVPSKPGPAIRLWRMLTNNILIWLLTRRHEGKK